MGKKFKKGKKKYKYKKTINVHCSNCPTWVDEDKVKFVDIEEDFQGADVLTFICPHCNTQQKSRRFG